jgi:hypothetical protein
VSTGARVSVGLLAGVPVLLLILATLGALSQTTVEGLPVVPWQTLWSLPLDRWVRDVAASIVLGFVVVGALLLPRLDHRLIRLASLAALALLDDAHHQRFVVVPTPFATSAAAAASRSETASGVR